RPLPQPRRRVAFRIDLVLEDEDGAVQPIQATGRGRVAERAAPARGAAVDGPADAVPDPRRGLAIARRGDAAAGAQQVAARLRHGGGRADVGGLDARDRAVRLDRRRVLRSGAAVRQHAVAADPAAFLTEMLAQHAAPPFAWDEPGSLGRPRARAGPHGRTRGSGKHAMPGKLRAGTRRQSPCGDASWRLVRGRGPNRPAELRRVRPPTCEYESA